MRARAHAAMAMEKREDDRWGKVAKGSGIARKAAKEMAKTMTTTAARDDDDATGATDDGDDGDDGDDDDDE